VKPIAQARVAVAGRGSFPPPPWPSAVTGRASVVFPGLAPLTDRSRCAEALVSSTSPSKRSKDGGNRLSPTPPLVGFAKCALSPTYRPRVHSREPKPPAGSRSPRRPDGYQPSGHVPSSWFRTTSTVSSARRSRVCCTPQPDKGSSRFTLTGARSPRPSEDGPEPGTLRWRSPRRGSHPSKSSLRRQPRRITAAVASLPLPSRRSGSTIRLGDAPIRRSGPPRHRARGAFTPPKRRGTAAHDLRRPKSHRSATWAGRSDQGRGGSTPSDPSRPESERPKTPSLVLRDRGREAWRGAASRPPKRAGCGSVESSRSGSASRPCSVDEVRCRQVTVAGDRRSFLPWALFPFEVPSCCRCVPAVPGRRPPRPKPRRADPRRPTRKRDGGGGSAGSLCGFTRGAGPKPFVATARGRPKPGHGPAPFQRGGRGPRVVTPRVSRPKPVSPRSQCPESLSGARVVRGWSAMPSKRDRHRSDGAAGRAPQGVLTDLHGVFDVKDRSEDWDGRGDRCA
jgi:hypothetical protein